MRKVLITGLGIGKDFGVCDARNMDYAELLINPEVLLWADKICIPDNDYFSDTIIDKECKLVFSLLEDRNLIYRYKVDDIDGNRFNNVLNLAAEDMLAIKSYDSSLAITNDTTLEEFDSSDRKYRYCAPRIASVYSALIVADEIGARCLFSNYDESFLDLRFVHLQDAGSTNTLNKVYKEIFTCRLPNEPILHEYGTHTGCSNCKKEEHCKDNYLTDVEKQLQSVLELRDCDEMVQLRAVIDDIILKRDRLLGKANAEEIISDLRYRQEFIRRNIALRFKKVKRFANLATTVSVPLTLIGLTNSNNNLSMAGGLATGVATVINKSLENYESKNNWVNFIEKK